MDDDEDECTRNKGTRIQTGKIIKGTLNEAPMKIRVASIPSKYQNILYHTPSKPAFGNSLRRFRQEKIQGPGPGVYNSSENKPRIMSKKGTGTFASQTNLKRLYLNKNYYPAPGSYKTMKNMSDKLKNVKSKSQLSLNSNKAQAHDLFKNQIKQSKQLPGPGQYSNNYLNSKVVNRSISICELPFKSKIDRFFQKINQVPPVGSYNVELNTKKPSTLKYKFPSKDNNKSNKDQYIDQIIGNNTEFNNNAIGPGTYNTSLNSSVKGFKMRQNIYDRFGNLKQVYQLAKNVSQNQFRKSNASQYNLTMNSFNQSSNRFFSTFNSKSKRMKFEQQKMDPGKYNPKIAQKMSHLVNFTKKWV